MALRAALFVTCLVDQFYPQVGESTVRLLRRLGVEVEFPLAQTCCGQPAFNSGWWDEARGLAGRFLNIFEPYQYVVAPSGSCTAMVRVFYPELFQGDSLRRARAQELAKRVFELSEFITTVLGTSDVGAQFDGVLTYHDSCHALRELRIGDSPRKLLRAVRGAEFRELAGCDRCCGFGGVFSVKYGDVSAAVLADKVANAEKSGAQYLVSSDVGCLMHIGGGLSRRGSPVQVRHLAEVLAGQAES